METNEISAHGTITGRISSGPHYRLVEVGPYGEEHPIKSHVTKEEATEFLKGKKLECDWQDAGDGYFEANAMFGNKFVLVPKPAIINIGGIRNAERIEKGGL